MKILHQHILITLCSEKGYTALFKAAVVLFAAVLVTLAQAGPFLYEKDINVHKAKYTLEASAKQQIEKIDCTKQDTMQIECMITKHELRTFDSSIILVNMLTQTGIWLGAFFAIFSLIGFVGAPFIVPNADVDTQ